MPVCLQQSQSCGIRAEAGFAAEQTPRSGIAAGSSAGTCYGLRSPALNCPAQDTDQMSVEELEAYIAQQEAELCGGGGDNTGDGPPARCTARICRDTVTLTCGPA
jgi:hypothetical protein